MKNTLRFSLMIIGIGLIAFGVYRLLFSNMVQGGESHTDSSQYLAMIGFGALCLMSGVAYKRK